MTGSRPEMVATWDEFKAAKSACWDVLNKLSAYRSVLRRVNAWCPHVALADDEMPDVDVRYPDLTYGIETWKRNKALAEHAVVEAEDELRKVIAQAQAQGKRPINFGLHTFDPDLLVKSEQPKPVSSGRSSGGSAFFG